MKNKITTHDVMKSTRKPMPKPTRPMKNKKAYSRKPKHKGLRFPE